MKWGKLEATLLIVTVIPKTIVAFTPQLCSINVVRLNNQFSFYVTIGIRAIVVFFSGVKGLHRFLVVVTIIFQFVTGPALKGGLPLTFPVWVMRQLVVIGNF